MAALDPEPRRRGYKPRFTRDEVFDAAVQLLDADPDAALTMRRLADHLGMGVMTLYGYVASKDEILEGVASRLFDGMAAGLPRDIPWHEQVRAHAVGIHEMVVRHPNVVRALRAKDTPNPSLFAIRERMLAALDRAGFDAREAVRAMGIVTAYAQGFGAVQASTPEPSVSPARVRELPAADFPFLHAAAGVYASHLSDATFHHGLDLIIAALRAAAPSEQDSPKA